MKYYRKNIRKDLIEKELNDSYNMEKGFTFSYRPLTKKFINWLYKNYKLTQLVENFYDSESDELEDWNYDDESYLHKEEYKKICENYEEKRLERLTWQDPVEKDMWGMSQKQCNQVAKETLKWIKSTPVRKRGRLFFAEKGREIAIYWYGRDLYGEDYWFIFEKKNK